MSLTIPDSDALLEWMRLSAWQDTAEEDYADTQVQLAADLLTMATGILDDPTDELSLRVITAGILSMAQALMIRSRDRSQEYNVFVSERIGSYSYSKAQGTAIQASGVPLFDTAVEFLRTTLGGGWGSAWTSSENVFCQPLPPTEGDLRRALRMGLAGADAYQRIMDVDLGIRFDPFPDSYPDSYGR